MGLCLGVVPGLDAVMDVTIITDLVVSERTPRGRLMPSLLLRLGAPGPWMTGAAVGGVAAACAHQ